MTPGLTLSKLREFLVDMSLKGLKPSSRDGDGVEWGKVEPFSRASVVDWA
jgi:hypothetical protein